MTSRRQVSQRSQTTPTRIHCPHYNHWNIGPTKSVIQKVLSSFPLSIPSPRPRRNRILPQ
jgi:hypothetical protein